MEGGKVPLINSSSDETPISFSIWATCSSRGPMCRMINSSWSSSPDNGMSVVSGESCLLMLQYLSSGLVQGLKFGYAWLPQDHLQEVVAEQKYEQYHQVDN